MKRAWIVGLALVALLAATGCTAPPAVSSRGNGPATPAASSPTTKTASQAMTSTPAAAPALAALSARSIADAKKLGGRSHKGATLYVVVITEDASQTVVRKRLQESVPFFGDTADYFIVQAGDAFTGLDAGQFVAFEANRSAAGAREARDWWADRVDEPWYSARVVKVKVRTSDPVPVVGTDVEKGN